MLFQRGEGGGVTHLSYRGIEAPRVEDAPPQTAAQLAELEGEYVSEELGTSYVAVVDDGRLVLRHRRHGTIRLTPAWRDDFRGSGPLGAVTFQRDARGEVTGLLVNAGERNRNLRFLKRR